MIGVRMSVECGIRAFSQVSNISKFLSIPHNSQVDRSVKEADNKILDEWMEEYKGRINTREAREEYRRRVLESVGGERLRPHTSRQD